MSKNLRTSAVQNWHSNDFLVRLAAGDTSQIIDGDDWAASLSSTDAEFGVASLSRAFGAPDRQEHLATLRETTAPDRDLVVFGARSRSTWALDVLAGRYTNHAHDWTSLRAAILSANVEELGEDPIIGSLSLWRS